jgi:Resolvase, N terminal domain/Helix-turn-helix domain of resolvase
LGRSLSGVIRTVETLTAAGVLLRSLREGIDYSTPTGRMLAGLFAALAGYERELMHERAAAAREAARLRGRHTGRPPRLTGAQARQVRSLRAGGESISELVRTFGVSRATVYRALQGRLGKAVRDRCPLGCCGMTAHAFRRRDQDRRAADRRGRAHPPGLAPARYTAAATWHCSALGVLPGEG